LGAPRAGAWELADSAGALPQLHRVSDSPYRIRLPLCDAGPQHRHTVLPTAQFAIDIVAEFLCVCVGFPYACS
jgi:hypothetical protein